MLVKQDKLCLKSNQLKDCPINSRNYLSLF